MAVDLKFLFKRLVDFIVKIKINKFQLTCVFLFKPVHDGAHLSTGLSADRNNRNEGGYPIVQGKGFVKFNLLSLVSNNL